MDAETLQLLYKLGPEPMETIKLRARVIERISVLQPVGRRALSQRMWLPEREIRGMCDALRDDELIDITTSGMVLSDRGAAILPSVLTLLELTSQTVSLESRLSKALSIGRVCIVNGNADVDSQVLAEAGRIAARHLTELLADGMTLTVSGGNSVAAVASAMPRLTKPRNVHVLPARGGMGMAFETQAGTLAASIANSIGGHHSPLYLPDSIPQDALSALMKLPEIGAAITAIHHTDVLLYGIGRVDVMSKSRYLPEAEVQSIMKLGAVGEAVGSYFDASGRLVYQASEVGLRADELRQVPHVVAIAAGPAKAEAVVAVMRHHHHELLITDEATAKRILEII